VNYFAQQALERGLSEMGLSGYISKVSQYISLLQQWNKAFNLIANVDELTLLNRHIFDCLAAGSLIRHGPCLDVGSGAGLPGLLLAVTMPTTEWVLLDSNGKKTRFCEQVVQELGLGNVKVVQQRIAQYEPEQCFASIISRAYSQAADFVHSTHKCALAQQCRRQYDPGNCRHYPVVLHAPMDVFAQSDPVNFRRVVRKTTALYQVSLYRISFRYDL